MHHAKWKTAVLTSPDVAILREEYSIRPGTSALARAEVAYAAAMAAMEQGDASCVDRFFRSARYAWDEIEYTVNAGDPIPGRVSGVEHHDPDTAIGACEPVRRLPADIAAIEEAVFG